jgi:hypothetical protein
VYVSTKQGINPTNNLPDPELNTLWYQWSWFNPIEFHPHQQLGEYPNSEKKPVLADYPKWMNAWSIKTPPGYSCLFTQPFHRNSVFTILDGVVDTDTYTAPVHFPFTFNDWGFEGLIPAGTPIAQVIPFKRESWEMEIGKEIENEESKKVTVKLHTKFFDSYKSQFRQIKEYN